MKSQVDEVKRLQRLRDQQLRNRDPNAKSMAQYQRTVSNYRKRQKKITVYSVIQDLPDKFMYMVIGALLGAVLMVILLTVFNEQWVKSVAWIAIVFGLVGGRLFGAARDWGKEDWIKRH